MADKLNISYKIEALDRFTKTHAKLEKQLNSVNRMIRDIPEGTNVNINVNENKAVRDVEKVESRLERLEKRRFRVTIELGYKEFRQKIDRIADTVRDFSTLFRHQLLSAVAVISPIVIPAIASIGGALGAIGPIIGTTAGGIMGIATSFGLAGTAAVAFGAMAAGALGKVFDVYDDIKRLQEKLEKTQDPEKRKKITEEMAAVMATLSKEQTRTYKSMEKLGKTWQGVLSSVEPDIVDAFTGSMDVLRSVITDLTPMFESVAKSGAKLAEVLKVEVQTESFQKFFDFLNTHAAPAFETLTKAGINFFAGFLNIMRAFGPLSVTMQDGLLGMSEGFRKWTKSLEGSDRFQAFIDYIKTNGPKLLDIFGNITLGLVGMFEAFAPMSADMLTGLQKLTERFQKWGQTLSDNPAFQKFIEYVTTNGPRMITFIGQLITFLVNLGIAFAPLGEKILIFANHMLELVNSFMENNRVITQVIAVIVWLASVVGFLLPIVLLLKNKFIGLGAIFNKVSGVVNKVLLPVFTRLYLAFGKVIPWVLRVGGVLRWFTGPIGIVIQIIILLAITVVKNWDTVWKHTKMIFSAIASFLKTTWNQIKTTFAIVGVIVSTVIRKFGDLKSKATNKMFELLSSIKRIWDNIMSFFRGIDLTEMGRNIMQGLINGVKSMAGSLVNSVKGAVGGAIDKAKNLLGIASPSKVFKQIGVFTGEGFIAGMDRMKGAVSKAGGNMANASIPNAGSYASRYDGFSGKPGTSVGTTNSYAGDTHSYRGMLEGATFVVREEADIDRIAIALGERTKDARRLKGGGRT